VRISCIGFEDKIVTFYIADESDDFKDNELIVLIPKDDQKTKKIRGSFRVSNKKAPNRNFYYALCLKEYTVIVSEKIKKNDNFIKLQVYDNLFFEGRKFVIDNYDKGILTLGNYDFIGRKYKVKDKFEDGLDFGQKAFLLFEGKTDKNSNIEIVIPNILQKEEFEILFVYRSKSCRVNAIINKEIKINLGS